MPTPKIIEYELSKDIGNFNAERIKVIAEILPGETAQAVLEKCRKFVKANLNGDDDEMIRAKQILADEDEHTGREVKWAKQIIARGDGAENLGIL